MATTLSRLISGVRDLCGKPDRAAVGDDVILGVIFDVQTSLNNELNLSSQNRLVEIADFALTAQAMDIPVGDFDTAERVEVIADGDTRYTPLVLVGLDQMPGAIDPAIGTPDAFATAVAFAGGRMYFDGLPGGARVRLWYKPVYGEPESTDESLKGVPEAFVSLVKLRAAAFIRENYLALPVTASMQNEINLQMRSFRKSATQGLESGLQQKSRYRAVGRGRMLVPGPGRWGWR
jgi:hypothetical protein